MFIQVIQGRVSDKEAVRATLDRWLRDVEPGAVGWLGGTYGFTDDNMLVAIVRFESKDAARQNAQRPEQHGWWREMENHFSGPITFHDSDDVMLLLGGGSDEAGFVQVIQGRVRDAERMHQITEQSASLISRYRPDILGGTIAISDDGFFTETVSFTSESAARQAEKQPMPQEASDLLNEEMSLLDDVTYLDLHQPWFASHR
jgi:hypothetical protein